jgi:HEAT repeat protein
MALYAVRPSGAQAGDGLDCLATGVPEELLAEVEQAMDAVTRDRPLSTERDGLLDGAFVAYSVSSYENARVVDLFRYAGAEALPLLEKRLREHDPAVRRVVAELLGTLYIEQESVRYVTTTDEAAVLVPLLIRTTYDVDPEVRHRVLWAISGVIALGNPDPLPRVTAALQRLVVDADETVRTGAAGQLDRMGRDDLVPPDLLGVIRRPGPKP